MFAMLKLLIFDLDGTLVDTLTTIKDAVNNTMRMYGFREYSYEEMRILVGHGAKRLIRDACADELKKGKEGEEFFNKIYADYSEQYRAVHLEVEKAYDGLAEVLERFSKAGYKLAVLSNKPDPFVKGIVDKIFPVGLISHAQGQTELPIKPDPTAPLEIAKTFGFSPEECAFIGDSDVDIQTGKNAKMFSVGVSWGYRDRDVLLSLNPDAIADTPAELEEIFIK